MKPMRQGKGAISWRRQGVVLLILLSWALQGAVYWVIHHPPNAEARGDTEDRPFEVLRLTDSEKAEILRQTRRQHGGN